MTSTARSTRLFFCYFMTLWALSGCEGDSGGGTPDRCENVSCFVHASCGPATGDCVCEAGYEGWTDGVGCVAESLAIVGSYTDDFGGHHEVEASLWTQSGFGNPNYFHLTHFSNEDRYVIALNNMHNAWSGGLWSRFDWTWFDGGEGPELWFCQSTFDAATEEAALAVVAPDATDPSSAGCGGFAWSKLTPGEPALVLAGNWTDAFGMSHVITPSTWTQSLEGSPDETYRFTLRQFSNANRWVVAQNEAGNPTGGSAWSRFDWTWFGGADEAGQGPELWYCQSVFAAASEEEALAAAPADSVDPSTGGCGVNAWSKMLPTVSE